MKEPSFGLQDHLEQLYSTGLRRLALRATTPAEFAIWRDEFRRELIRVLGLTDRRRPGVRAEKLDSLDCDGYVEERYSLDVGEGVAAPMYVLVPKARPPFKPVLVSHGHDPSVQFILGRYPDHATAAQRLASDNNYAQRLAQAGYLVCAVELRSFGQRRCDDFGQKSYTSCRQQALWYMMHGRTVLGERCHDSQCAIDYLATRTDIAQDRLAATGNSGGGTVSLWLAAIDDRVSVCIPSCYLCSFHDSILSVFHCDCNYVPGILSLGEMGDLAATIAPRPFRAIAGKNDPLFPLASVREQYRTVERAYDLLGAADRCSLTVHDGSHAYNVAMAVEWLKHWL